MQKGIFILLLAVSTTFVISCKSETKADTTQTTETKATTTEEVTTPATTVSLDNANYAVDAANSSLSWTGSKAAGDKHSGSIKLQEGSFLVENGQVSIGQAVIDMNSIDNTDLEGKWKQKLEDHLKGEDFFFVSEHPTATIDIKSNTEGTYTGDLTLRGVKKSINIPATVATEGDNVIVTISSFNIDRTEWGVKYNSGKFFQNLKDKLINDNIQISGKIVLTPKG